MFPAQNPGVSNPGVLAFLSLLRLLLCGWLTSAFQTLWAHQSGEDCMMISISLLPRFLSCLVKSENGTCSQSKTFQRSPKSLKCAMSEFFKAAFDLMSLGSSSLYNHSSHWHLPLESLSKISSSFGLAFELSLISRVDLENVSKKTLFFQKVRLWSLEVWGVDFF